LTHPYRYFSPGLNRERKDPLPRPVGYALPIAAQKAVSHLCHKGALLIHGQHVIHQDSQGLSTGAVFQTSSLKHALMLWIVPPQERDFAPPAAGLYGFPVSPFFQPMEVSLYDSLTL